LNKKNYFYYFNFIKLFSKNCKIEIKCPDSITSTTIYSNNNTNIIPNNNLNVSENQIKVANLSSDFIKSEIETSIDFKKKLIEPCKIIIKDYQLTDGQLFI